MNYEYLLKYGLPLGLIVLFGLLFEDSFFKGLGLIIGIGVYYLIIKVK